MFVTSDEKHNREERCDRQKSKKPPSLRKTAGRYKRNFAQAVQRAIPRPPALRSSGFLTFCVCLSGGACRGPRKGTSGASGFVG